MMNETRRYILMIVFCLMVAVPVAVLADTTLVRERGYVHGDTPGSWAYGDSDNVGSDGVIVTHIVSTIDESEIHYSADTTWLEANLSFLSSVATALPVTGDGSVGSPIDIDSSIAGYGMSMTTNIMDVETGDGIEIVADAVVADLASEMAFRGGEIGIATDGVDDTMIDWGTGANQVCPADFVGTDITAAELETLSDGSNADALHTHAGIGGHDILDGVTHTDSVADAVTRGSIIIGNATPKWDELVIGANTHVLTSDGTDISWAAAPGAADLWYTLTYDNGNTNAPDTTANVMFVGGTGIDTAGAAGTPPVDLNITFAFDSTEIGSTVWGSGAAATWTFDASAGTDATVTFGNDIVTFATANLGTDGSIFIQEIADAIADIAGWGQLWVNTATPNELWFTDDAGTDFQLGVPNTDVYVKVDAAANAGYIGAASNDGVLRVTTANGLTWTDWGDYVSIGFDADYTDISANDAATGITGAELETLSDGSDADSLHTHTALTQFKAITIESPTSSEDLTLFFTDLAITVTQIAAVSVGSTPSLTYTIRHGTDRNAAGAEVVTGGSTTTSTTTGDIVTGFNDATIVADSWVWLESTAQSGTNTHTNITVRYTHD